MSKKLLKKLRPREPSARQNPRHLKVHFVKIYPYLTGETKTKQVKASADAKPDAKISGLMSETVTEPGWKKVLAAEFAKPYYAEIEKYVAKERKTDTPIFPPHHEVYNAFNFTPYDKVKVVIIGQDPYFNPNQGEGLCFSVKKGVAIPPSLNRIYKVLIACTNCYPGC